MLVGRGDCAQDASVLERTMRGLERFLAVGVDVFEFPSEGVVVSPGDIPAVRQTVLGLAEQQLDEEDVTRVVVLAEQDGHAVFQGDKVCMWELAGSSWRCAVRCRSMIDGGILAGYTGPTLTVDGSHVVEVDPCEL